MRACGSFAVAFLIVFALLATNCDARQSSGPPSNDSASAPSLCPSLSSSSPSTPTLAYQIDVANLAAGAVAPNAVAPKFFENPAAVVSENTYWTPKPTKYLSAKDPAALIAKSVYCSRDEEVDTWTQNGTIYLRLNRDGSAIYFKHNGGVPNGYLEIGFATGLGRATGGTFYPLYKNSDLRESFPGYDPKATAGAVFGFGVSGFSVFVDFNGRRVVQFRLPPASLGATRTQGFMRPGVVAASALPGYGFRNIAVKHLPSSALYSDYANNELDTRDFGVITTPASMASLGYIAGTQLTITSVSRGTIRPGMLLDANAIGRGDAPAMMPDTMIVSQLSGAPGGVGIYTVSNSQSLAAADAKVQIKGYYGLAAGTIAAGSDQLKLSNPTPLTVGDFVIVQIGGERGAGLRGSIGVGGAWPARRYETLTALKAAANLPANTFAWAKDTGDVWQYNAGAWVQPRPYYYTSKALPQSLQAQIIAISSDGLVLTLDRKAIESATNAAVYPDNGPLINFLTWRGVDFYPLDLTPLIPGGVTISLPAGLIAVGGEIVLNNHNGWTVEGKGRYSTMLFSPNGIHAASVILLRSPYSTVRDLSLIGNAGQLNYYGLAADTAYNDKPTSIMPGGFAANGALVPQYFSFVPPLTQTTIPQPKGLPYGIDMDEGSDNSVVKDVVVDNVFNQAVGAQHCSNCWASNVVVNIDADFPIYTQWQMDWVNTLNGGCKDCVINASHVVAGLEVFRGTGTTYVNPVLNNALLSLNAASDWTVEHPVITITGPLSPSIVPNDPIVNINSNTGPSGSGSLENPIISQPTYVDEAKDVLRGIVVGAGIPDVHIRGGRYTAPDSISGATTGSPIAIATQATGTVIDGFVAQGKVAPGRYNIEIYAPGTALIKDVAAPSVSPLLAAMLPNGVAPGTRSYVTDAVTCVPGSVVAGGGSTFCPVVFTGSHWQGD